MWQPTVFLVLCLLSRNLESEGAKILAVFPFPSVSHSTACHTLTLELARRGHDLVVFAADPVKDNVPSSYNQIDLSYLHATKKSMKTPPIGIADTWQLMDALHELSNILVDEVYAHPAMQQLIAPNSNATFDLVVMEWALWDGLSALAHRFSAPLIGISTLNLNVIWHYTVGNPLASAYIPEGNLGYTNEMNIWERIVNLYYNARMLYVFDKYLERQDHIPKKYLGKDTPHIRLVTKNVSLLLVYSDPIIFYPRPNVPAVIEISGYHVKRKKNNVELPKPLKSFLDEAANGFIYFSLGSTVPGSSMPERSINEILNAFAELPYKVLWKWENDTLRGKPDNVFISKWLPQHQILAHPNIGVFMYQGGLQSTEEAIEYAVPVVGIPLFADQQSNVRKMEHAGAGKRIQGDLMSIRKEDVKAVLTDILTDKRYKERMIKLRELKNDRPQDVLENAVWWTEYVIRHKGASHLRVQALNMTWYQLSYLDIAALLIFILLVACFIIYYAIKYAAFALFQVTSQKKANGKLKSN